MGVEPVFRHQAPPPPVADPGPGSAAAGAAPLERLLASANRAPQRDSLCLQVPHVRQSHNWDCGLACVLMVLQAYGVHSHGAAALRQLCRTESIWTVDLAHLLRHLSFEVAFLTVTLGANPDYASETFYRDHMEEDEARVARLFREAPSKGIALHKRSLGLRQLQNLVLAGQHLLVMLLDKRVLGSWAEESRSELYGARSLMLLSYTGHYVVVCGFDAATQEFSVCDPAGVSSPIRVPAQCLEEARQSFGTDEDILLVSHRHWRLRVSAAEPAAPPCRHDLSGALPAVLSTGRAEAAEHVGAPEPPGRPLHCPGP